MPSVLLVIAAVLMSGSCALAQAQCDRYCVVIKRALDDRKNNFGGLQGKLMGDFSDAWWTNISPPEMTCRLFYHHDYKPPKSSHPKLEPYWQFYCRTRDDLTNGKQHLKSVFSAFRQIEPKWKMVQK